MIHGRRGRRFESISASLTTRSGRNGLERAAAVLPPDGCIGMKQGWRWVSEGAGKIEK